MTWIIIILALILLALWSIGTALEKLANVLQNKELQANNNNSVNLDTSGIEEELRKIVSLLGGDEKFEAKKQKERKELKQRLIQAIMYSKNKSEKDAKKEAETLWDEAEFEEKLQGGFAWRFERYKTWVEKQEIDKQSKQRYGKLLPKMRAYLKNVTTINKYNNLEKELETDYFGKDWLIEKMIEEKRLEEVKEFDPESGQHKIIHYKVVKP